jgi:hypothetical protein
MRADIAKLDVDRRLAFGWAYVADDDGHVVMDHSGDFVDKAALPDLEDAAYEYVLHSREGDEMHVRTSGVAKLIESVLVTPDKLAAMGLTGTRTGWWVGFKVVDSSVWAKVKAGEYPAFSIRGIGVKEEV